MMVRNTIIYDMIHREHSRILKELEYYEEMIHGLPTGSVRITREKYVYRAYYDEGKSAAEYIGPQGEEAAEEFLRQIRMRKYYEDVVKELKQEKRELEDYIRVGKKYHKEIEKEYERDDDRE